MNMEVATRLFVIALCVFGSLKASAQQPQRGGTRADRPSQRSTCTDVPPHPIDVILCRPTKESVKLCVLAYQDTVGLVAYGPDPGQFPHETQPRPFPRGEPVDVVLGNLQPDQQYYYQIRADGIGQIDGRFRTQRARGTPFTFTITADSHLDERVDAGLYQRTLANALQDDPDFHVDLGDTFMTDKHSSRANATQQYLAQRYYFGQLCHAAPLFLVLGNHDGETPRGRDSQADSLAVWSNRTRKQFFPNPIPDSFFSGNAVPHPAAGLLENYYSWQWGDALFIVLDPYWFTPRQRGQKSGWNQTLGTQQYHWLAQMLETSTARFKFIFIHQLVGGATPEGRGGVEAAKLFEWGGKDADGTEAFAQHRPDWPMPIHALLVEHQVSAVFHGHDHLFVKQELDGIVYQEVPQPGDPRGQTRTAAEYGYHSGLILPSSGHLRVRVSATSTTVDYVRAVRPSDERPARRNAIVEHSYNIPARLH